MSLTKSYFDQKHTELMTKILSLEKGIEALRNENLELKEENTVLKTEVVNLKKSCLQVELVSKRQNILLHGIPAVQGGNSENATREFLSELGVSNANSMPFVKCYRLNGNKPPGSNTRATSRTTLKAGPVFVTLANLADKDAIMKNCGRLKGSGKSITSDLPRELARRRKELLSFGYNLRTSSDTSTRVAETRVITKGISVWIEAKKSSKSKTWLRIEDSCFDPFKLSSNATSVVPSPAVIVGGDE